MKLRLKDLITVQIPRSEAPFAVPVESESGVVGPGFIRWLAEKMGGLYERDPDDIGLMDDFSVLRGRWLDPERVHPLIVEFYEHTMRFTLSVKPEWHRRWLPLFWIFRRGFAERVGQFTLPFDIEDERRGVETHIDTIDVDRDEIKDLRGWVRTYAGSEQTIYVGIYTAMRIHDLGYVSVGFPLPNANLTATLVPANVGEHDFILRTGERQARYAGDYLITVDERTDNLCVFRLRGLREEIQVYVEDGQLLADHRFYFLWRKFLTLRYTMERRAILPERTRAQELIRAAASLDVQADPASL
jgi:hypothetical protein